MQNKENLTENVQVLLSKSDLQALTFLLTKKALMAGEKPLPLSSYVREILKDHIQENSKNQFSFVHAHVEKVIQEYKKLKTDNDG